MIDDRKSKRRKSAEDKLRKDDMAYELRRKNQEMIIENAGREVSQKSQDLIDGIKEDFGDIEERKELFLESIEKLEQMTREQARMREEHIENIEWTVLLGLDIWEELDQPKELATEFFDNPEIHNVTLLYELEKTSSKEIVNLLSEQINPPDKFYIGTVNGRRELVFRAPVFDHDEYYVSSQATEDYIGGKKSLKELAEGIYDITDLISLTVDEEHLNIGETFQRDSNIEVESIFYDVCTEKNILPENERKSIDDSFRMEQQKWKETLEKFCDGKLSRRRMIEVGQTPNLAVMVNAKPLPICIGYAALENAMADVTSLASRRHSHGHNLKNKDLEKLLEYIRNPLLVFQEEKIGTTSLTIITDGKNEEGKEIVVALALDKMSDEMIINKITTIFPAENVNEYISDKLEKHTLLAVNKKANELATSRGNSLEGQFINFDHNIPYVKNVVNLEKLKQMGIEELKEIGVNKNVVNHIQYNENDEIKLIDSRIAELSEKAKELYPYTNPNNDGFDTNKREEFYSISKQIGELKTRSANLSQERGNYRIPVAIESTIDYQDSEIGFVSAATENMPAGTKYRLVTYGEDGRLVPYQEESVIYGERIEASNYLKEHADILEAVNYDEMVYQSGRKFSEYTMKQHEIIDKGMHSFEFEDGYLYFSIDINGYSYDGLYRIYDPDNGKSREIVNIYDGHKEPMIKENMEYIEHELGRYVNEHPLIGDNGEEIPREKASIYCEWSEHDAFERGKVYSVSEFDRLMAQADSEWRELRKKEREQYGGAEEAFEKLSEQRMPQHQGYAKVKFTIYIPGMPELTLRQDVGDGFGGVIDFIRKTVHKHYVEPLENAVRQEGFVNQLYNEFKEEVNSNTLEKDTIISRIQEYLNSDFGIVTKEDYDKVVPGEVPYFEIKVAGSEEFISIYSVEKREDGLFYKYIDIPFPDQPLEEVLDDNTILLNEDMLRSYYEPFSSEDLVAISCNNEELILTMSEQQEILEDNEQNNIINEAAITAERKEQPLLKNEYSDYAESHKKTLQNTAVNRIPVVINAFGGPGSGKSVSCMDVCQQLKKLGYNAEYVQEYAKELVYDKNWDMLDGTPEHQFEVLKEQLNRVDRLYGSVDFIVTDSPVLLNSVYNKSLTPEYDEMVTSLYKDFENFTYFVERDASSYQQEGRIQNLEESQKIDQDIKQLLKDKDVYYGTYNHNTIDKVVSNSIKTFNRINHIEEEASQKQIAYAKKIADSLGIDTPEEKTKAAYSAFIGEHQEEFSNNNAPLREPDVSADSYQDYFYMVAKDGSKLKDVPSEHYTDELLLAAVSNWGAALRNIPEERITRDLALASVQQYGLNLKYVPESLRDLDLCVAAYISSSGKSLRFTPNELKNQVKEEGQKNLADGNNASPNSQRQLEIEKLQEKGKEWLTQIDNILKEHEQNPEAMVEDIIFAAKFYQYSSKNIQLMIQQNPGITYVASASAFEKMGYHVKENEPAMIARVPLFSKYVVNEKNERIYSWNYTPEIKKKIELGTMKEEQAVRGFQFVAAFYDISQTDCPAEDYPSIFNMGVSSELHQEAFDAMKEFAEKSLGFKVMVTDLKSISLRGNCEPDNRIIRINDKLESTMALSTLCHEIAHGIIHTSKNATKMSTAQKECEADVMDIMLESSLGLPINESRREHLFHHFHEYKKEQAEKEQPYEVTLEKLIDRVQKKVFRPYAEDINSYLTIHLPSEGSQNEEIAKEVIQNIALLDSAYATSHDSVINKENELFDISMTDGYQELYRQTKEEYRLSNSFVPKLAVMKSMDGGEYYHLCDVQLLDETTADLIRSFPETISPEFLQNIEPGNILALKENVLADSRLYLVTREGLKNVTEELKGKFDTVENKINCGFDAESEYQCIHNLLKNGIELEPVFMKTYDYLCKSFGFPKNLETDSGMRLMARINLVTEGLSRNNRELIAEYVFRTGNYKKAEQYAEQIERKPECIRKLLQEMKLVDSYKYMLWTIAEYESNNAVSEGERITTGAYNESAIPVLSDNVNSLSQINNAFLHVRKYASTESIKLYSIVEEDNSFRIAYVELHEYKPEVTYSTVSFADYEEAVRFYEQYLETPNSRMIDSGQAEYLAELEDKENQIALSDITSIGDTVASRKHRYQENGLDEEAAFELLRAEIGKTDDIKPAERKQPDNEIQILKDFKKKVCSYGEEHFIELCCLQFYEIDDNIDAVVMEQSLQLAEWLREERNILENMTVTGTDDVKMCVDAGLNGAVMASDIEKAFNVIDYVVLSDEFSGLEKEFEGFEEYNDVLDTLKEAHVTPDKFCYVDFDEVPGPCLYTSDQAGNIYRKSLRNDWDGSVRELNTRLKEGGYEICTSMDDFRAYSVNNRLGRFNTTDKGKSEAYIRILESNSDILQKNTVLSIYDFKNTLDKIYSGSNQCKDDITYKLVTRKNQEIHSYIDTYSGTNGQNVYEQLYEKAKDQNPELSRVISRQYYQDQINFNEKHLMKPLLERLKGEGKPAGESEELSGLLESTDKLREEIKKLDLSPADAELLKLNEGIINTEQINEAVRQMQMNQQAQQRNVKRQQEEISIL